MEGAPLTLAHAHARRASQESQRARLTVAANEHESAAGEFARAAQDTADDEALRILKLLEQHHQKLAQIIKTKHVVAKVASASPKQSPEDAAVIKSASPPIPAESPVAHTPSFMGMTQRRDSSPALAKDMASRRGIPTTQPRRTTQMTPHVSAFQASGRMTSPSPKPLHVESQDKHSVKPLPSSQTVSPTVVQQEDGFAKFYSNLTAGPLSKLSSMLAFAGLPLAEESQVESSSAQLKSEKTSAHASSGPDVKQLFSKAALRALDDQQRNQGFSGNTFGPGESFYVIPTSGGTVSYADMLSKAQQDVQRHATSDEFVDARESQQQNGGEGRKKIGQGTAANHHREEELQLENAALKQILDKLSHRLQAFESHAQDASMAALTQSMASIRGHAVGPVADAEERMRTMEQQLDKEMREKERLDMEVQRQKQVIAKYRSHWEQLKDSARAKDKAKRERGDSAASRA